jgi:hypothetical protein
MMVITSERVRFAVRDMVFSPSWVGFNLSVRIVWASWHPGVLPKLEAGISKRLWGSLEFVVLLILHSRPISTADSVQPLQLLP